MKEKKTDTTVSKKPMHVMKFENLKQANQMLDWWKKRLFLQAWTIDIVLVTREEMEDMFGKNIAGEVKYSVATQEACIFIAEPGVEMVKKSCNEETLVHELLHLKIYLTSITDTDLGSRMIDLYEHQNVESLAKSFIMIKYDLPFEWFRNKTTEK